MKNCNYCTEDIANNSIKCKHCGEIVKEKYKTTKIALETNIKIIEK